MMAASAQSVKQEVDDDEGLANRVLAVLREHDKGVSDAVLGGSLPKVTPQQRAKCINSLIATGQIDILKGNKGLIYRLKDPTTATKAPRGCDNQEKLVYQIIEDSGNIGIWTRDIRYKCNLLLTQVNKILKNLEGKKLIKAVKSVAAAKKKVYMLYDLEPDRSVTGGAWYSDQDFEAEFVDVLNQQCFKFLQQKAATATRESQGHPIAQVNGSYVPSHDVWRFITELGISKVQLSKEDIETILETLIYDGKVERTLVAMGGGSSVRGGAGQSKLYRAVRPLIQSTSLMTTPCGVCKVIDQCCVGGAISPTNCVYMKDWLDF